MCRCVLYAALAGALVPAGARAQSLMLTEAAALARLSSESPRVRAIRSAIDVARADVLEAGRLPNPRVGVNREAVAGVTEYMTTVSQPLPVTGRRALDAQAASALVAASTSRADDDVRRLRADLRLAFAELVAAQTRERELTAAGDRLRDVATVLGRREAEGEAAGFDRLRAEREVFDLEADLAIASAERMRAQALLASFITGAPDPSMLVAVAPDSPAVAPVPPVDVLLEQAESTRGELAALRHEIEAARLAARAAHRRLVPEPELLAGAKTSSSLGGDLGSVISLYAAVPLFDRARPERALAAAREARAEAQADAFRLVLRGQVEALRAVLLQRRLAADRYRAEAVSSAADIERIAQISYDAGEQGILELLDAYRVGAASRTRQAALDFAVRVAEIELAFATGWELPS
jgi:cobalt-zinc-cadmium efflux system outer membrane protein